MLQNQALERRASCKVRHWFHGWTRFGFSLFPWSVLFWVIFSLYTYLRIVLFHIFWMFLQVHGITNDTIDFVRRILETEMNSATDNPVSFVPPPPPACPPCFSGVTMGRPQDPQLWGRQNSPKGAHFFKPYRVIWGLCPFWRFGGDLKLRHWSPWNYVYGVTGDTLFLLLNILDNKSVRKKNHFCKTPLNGHPYLIFNLFLNMNSRGVHLSRRSDLGLCPWDWSTRYCTNHRERPSLLDLLSEFGLISDGWLGSISPLEIGSMHLSVAGLRPWDWSYPVLQYLREWPTPTVVSSLSRVLS